MKKHTIPLYAQLIGLATFVALLIGTVVFFVTVFDADPYRPPVVLDRNYDRSVMQSSLSTNAVLDRYHEITGFGSRAPGQEGLEKTARLIEKSYADAGLECYTQDVMLPYPLTKKGSGHLSLANGTKLPVWPFWPNYVQVVTTGEKGIDGELFLATEENIRKTADFSDKIAVIDLSLPVFTDLGYNPAQYAELGCKAIIVTMEDSLDKIPWKQLATMTIHNLPVNIVRLVAEQEILSHIGEKVHIDARSNWVNARTRNIIGILRAKEPTEDALVIPATYDSHSLVQDIALGSQFALQTAIQLQLLDGILPHRDALKRDIIFVSATGSSQSQLGLSRLLSTIGNIGKSDYMRTRIEADLLDNEKHISMLKEIDACFEKPAFALFEKSAETDAVVKALPAETRKFLGERVSAVLRKRVFEQAETLLQANIAYRRNPDDLTTPEYHAFRVAKKRYDDLNNMSALPLARAIERKAAENPDVELADGSRGSIREALKDHVERLLAFHADKKTSLEKDLALQKLFASYKDFLVISPRVTPSSKPVSHETISYASGFLIQTGGEACNLFGALLNDAAFALGVSDKVTITAPRGGSGYKSTLGGSYLDTNPWAVIALPAFSILNPQNSAAPVNTPTLLADYEDLSSVANTLQIVGEAVLSAGRGYGNFPRLPFNVTYSMNGNVYAAGIGNSVVPNYAVENALVASLDFKPKFFTDPYGNYSNPFLTMPDSWNRWQPPEAFIFGKEGDIQYVKDYGAAAQFIYASRKMPNSDIPVNLIVYRAAPVAILNVINPQSMKAFTGIEFLSRSGLNAFPSTCPYITNPNAKMDFLPPAEYFFLTLKAGAPGNELVATTRAFCLGTTHTNDPSYKPSDNEIDGAGYLAADTPIFRNITHETATSMDYLAAKRLNLQNQYGMADEMTLTFNDRAEQILAEETANEGHESHLVRLRNLRQGLSYLILNHPVIRDSVSEAVWGILWYMGLLVPFIFFFEKLLFGFTDIRKQIMAEGIIFLVIFALLRILHPAFHMIRSSAMILLGFVIIIIVGSVTAVLSSKFQENLDALRKAQGAVKGANGNKMGIIMTAFMLGLNNMHKRKVRTGLTCATLVLMTFVMISFTSVQSNVVEKEQAIGRAPYQGILVREKLFRPISQAEVDALNASYGEDHTVNVREMLIGYIDNNQNRTVLPDFKMVYGEGDRAAMKIAKGALLFNHTEPLAKNIRLLTTNGWFTAEQAALNEGPYPVMIPDTVAEQLGILPEDVNRGDVHLTIGGNPYYVWGIFDSREFETVVDVDGQNLLPFDVEALSNPQSEERMVLAELTDPRLTPSDLFLGLRGQTTVEKFSQRNASVVVDMGTAPYAVAKREITSYLEQTGRDTTYGIDGTAFNGRRARVRSMAGMADLLIPLIIAALTVLNTMKGSVYERHDEIFVYNAVGIAPRYIFFMFVAEALVYSVVGAVLGYILSQGVGRILTILDWTGGMNMNFTSTTTIYASLAIALATLASTYFPARSAMEIAKPTEDAGWTMPKPKDDDSIEFMLPFTFTPYDRIAVLAFFYNYFENHGEGSAGAFFSGVPELKIADHTDDLADGAYIPCLDVQVWLKPFDLGVSQRITIELATDPDTHEFISKMRLARVTGTRDAWLRLNGPLVKLIRQHFLHWRAVPLESKTEYFQQAKALIEETVLHSEA